MMGRGWARSVGTKVRLQPRDVTNNSYSQRRERLTFTACVPNATRRFQYPTYIASFNFESDPMREDQSLVPLCG